MGADFPEGEGLSLAESPAPVFVVYSLAQAEAALGAAADAGRPVVLLSAPDAGIHAGPGWFKALADAARAAPPTVMADFVLDCGDDAGAAQGALRAGISSVIFTGRADVAGRLAAIAAATGARVLTARPPEALDLLADFFAGSAALRARCAAFLRRET